MNIKQNIEKLLKDYDIKLTKDEEISFIDLALSLTENHGDYEFDHSILNTPKIT